MPIPTNRSILSVYGSYPWADEREFKSDLGAAAYAVPSDTFHTRVIQATFDIATDGAADQGLRVTIDARLASGEASNGFSVVVEVGAALLVSVNAEERRVHVVLGAASTMAQLKAAIDAFDELSSEYFGGEDGSGATDAQDVSDSSGGRDAYYAYVRISPDDNMLMYVGLVAPTDDEDSVRLLGGVPYMFRMPINQRIWFKRGGAADVGGGAELWRDGTAA